MIPDITTHCSVTALSPADCQQAEILAERFVLPFAKHLDKTQHQLVFSNQHLELRTPDLAKPIRIDFTEGKNAHRRQFGGGRGQPLAKAVGLKKGATPTIVDTTAGYGNDAFVLATLGCHITLIERNPLLAALLENAIARARLDPNTEQIAQRMTLIHSDASQYLTKLTPEQRPDVIYIDPMYPSRQKSALVKKEMQLLHHLVGPDTDSEQLLDSARHTAMKRVVVKRPKSAKPIAEQKPSTSVESKNTRYDIYI
jgi:16S rRNA (guanine1516-N2)-methyltransferase